MAVNPEFFEELKRRNVLRVATAFAAASFVILQICDIVFPAVGLSDDAIGAVIIALFPALIAFAWMFEFTPEGLRFTQ
ncbi:MAG: hypothetical protein CMQ19_01560 [Gammaproteobacteria bacterium]|nr:hypothetical protein [Gammaproteobacteria bacterium]